MIRLIRLRFVLFLSLLIFGQISISLAQPAPLHLKATRALLNYLANEYAAIKALDQDRLIAEEGILQAESAYDTTVNLSLGASETYNIVDQQNSPNSQREEADYDNQLLSADIVLSKKLYDFGLIDLQVNAAERNLMLAQNRIKVESEKVYLSALKAYYATLRSLARTKIREQYIAILESKLDEAERRVRAGIGTQSAVISAKANLAQGVSNLRNEEAGYLSALNNLKVFAPESFEQYLQLFSSFPELNSNIQSMTLEAALQQQENLDPVLTLAKTQIRLAEAQFQSSADADNPQVKFNVNLSQRQGYGYTRQANTSGSASVNFSMPLINGRSFDSRVRSAKQNLDKARLNYRAAVDQQSARLKQTWFEFTAQEELINASQTNIEAQDTLVERAEAENAVGRTPIRVLLDQYDRQLDARLQHIESLHQRIIKGLELISLMGMDLRDSLQE